MIGWTVGLVEPCSICILHVLHSALGALVDYAPPSERAAYNREAADLAAQLSDRPRELRALMRLMFDCVELAVPDLDQGIAFYAKFGLDVLWRRGTQVGLAMPETDAEIGWDVDSSEPGLGACTEPERTSAPAAPAPQTPSAAAARASEILLPAAIIRDVSNICP